MENDSPISYPAVKVEGAERSGPWVVTCDHATNNVPDFVAGGALGIDASDMERHIAYDIGAAGLTRALAELLDAPAVLSNFSRLVIDPNRGEDDPTLVMQLYDGTMIPANRGIPADDHQARLTRLYHPYHDAVSKAAGRLDMSGVYVAIHSFTPQLLGRPPRPWHIGVLYAEDTRFSDALLDRLQQETDLCVGANEPYNGKLRGDSVDKHALQHNRLNALIEIRSDLIETPSDQIAWAKRLAPILEDTRRTLHLTG